MTSTPLENLVQAGSLKREPATPEELRALFASGRARLRDAGNESLALESRFDLAYNAAHALALAALRSHGYRPENRYVVFQSLEHTAAVPARIWRVLATAHAQRNFLEYEGGGTPDRRLTLDLIDAVRAVEEFVRKAVAGVE